MRVCERKIKNKKSERERERSHVVSDRQIGAAVHQAWCAKAARGREERRCGGECVCRYMHARVYTVANESFRAERAVNPFSALARFFFGARFLFARLAIFSMQYAFFEIDSFDCAESISISGWDIAACAGKLKIRVMRWRRGRWI